MRSPTSVLLFHLMIPVIVCLAEFAVSQQTVGQTSSRQAASGLDRGGSPSDNEAITVIPGQRVVAVSSTRSPRQDARDPVNPSGVLLDSPGLEVTTSLPNTSTSQSVSPGRNSSKNPRPLTVSPGPSMTSSPSDPGTTPPPSFIIPERLFAATLPSIVLVRQELGTLNPAAPTQRLTLTTTRDSQAVNDMDAILPIPVQVPQSEMNIDAYTPFTAKEAEGYNFTQKMLWYYEFVCQDPCHHWNARNPRCAVCHCDSACLSKGDCCPKIFFQNPEVTSVTPPCPALVHMNDSFYMVTSCRSDLDLTDNGRKCRDPSLEWRQQLPVADMKRQVTYRNKYCALCNDVKDYTPWKLAMDCTKGNTQKVATAATTEDLYWMAVREKVCSLIFEPPQNLTTRMCTPVPEPLISSCNVTGRWRVYDPRIIRACASHTAPITNYRNVFCHLCNNNIVWRNDRGDSSSVITRVSLVAILNLQDDPSESWSQATAPISVSEPGQKTFTCDSGSFLDSSSNRCRPLTCSRGKQVKNGDCRSVVSWSNFIRYRIQADVTLTTSLSDLKRLNMYMYITMGSVQKSLRENFFVLLYMMKIEKVSCDEKVTVSMHSSIELFPRSSISVDSTEVSLLAMVNDAQANYSQGAFWTHWKLSNRSENDLTHQLSSSGCSDHNFTQDDIRPSMWQRDGFPSDYKFAYRKAVVVQLTPLRTCAHVVLRPDEVSYNSETNTLTLLATNTTVTYPYFSRDNDTATTCLSNYLSGFGHRIDNYMDDISIYDSWQNASGNNSTPPFTSTPSGIVSFSCTVISLTFLALTLLVFAMFKELRTISGLCSMCMVGVLILAQAVFEFGAEQTEIAGLCVALGVLAHYLWLSATFWMNACTFIMFYKLMFPLKARLYLVSRIKVLAVASLYAFISPGFIVSSTMVANHFLFGDLGYGGDICYIKRATTRRFAVALPIGCLVLTNLLLFLSTIIRLRRGSNVTSSREMKIGLFACAKLSVITGLSWMFLFLYEWLPYEAMEYVVIILFGSYGLVVFLAFVLNQHVIGLFTSCLKGKRSKPLNAGKFHHLSSNGPSGSSAETSIFNTQM